MTDTSPEIIDQLPPVETPRARYWSNGVRFFSVLLVVGLIALLAWGLVQASKNHWKTAWRQISP